VNRPTPSLDFSLSIMLLTLFASAALVILAAVFVIGMAIGLYVVAPILGMFA
jgi:hypothetical protein